MRRRRILSDSEMKALKKDKSFRATESSGL
jgi:hypothetical protein